MDPILIYGGLIVALGLFVLIAKGGDLPLFNLIRSLFRSKKSAN
jgi:hypothetical protein